MGKFPQTLHNKFLGRKGGTLKKSARIEMRLTPEEKAEIVKNSIKAKMSISEFLIKTGMEKEIKVVNGLDKISLELRRIGNNINQLTKKANSGIITCVNLEGVKKELDEIWQLLSSLITK